MAVTRGIVGFGGVRQETGTTTRGTVVGVRQETVAAAGGTTIAPAAGEIVIQGFAPTVSAPVTIAPDAGSIVIGGFAPNVIAPQTVAPDAGSVVIGGFAPTVDVSGGDVTRIPDAGTIVLQGFAPEVIAPQTVAPDAGTIVIGGQAPTVIEDVIRQPGAGSIVVQGFAPTIGTTDNILVMIPDAGTIIINGFAPTVTGGEATPSVQPAVGGGVGRRRRGQRTYRAPVMVEIRDGQVYLAEDKAEAVKIVQTVRKQEERRVRQALKTDAPEVDLPPLPVIRIGGEWYPWVESLQDDVSAANDHMAAFYAKAVEELERRRDEDDAITALLLT